MTLKELMEVTPGYVTVHVHDKKGKIAHRGNPQDFSRGLYNRYANWLVCSAVPLSSYTLEVTIEEGRI